MMRYFSLLLAAMLLLGCATASTPAKYQGKMNIPQEMNVYGYDFTEYADEGFLILPEMYEGGDYRGLGILQVTVWPEMQRTVEGRDEHGDIEYGPWEAKRLTVNAAVDSLVQQARSMGADGLVDFETSRLTEEVGRTTRVGVRARGFAIDRENN